MDDELTALRDEFRRDLTALRQELAELRHALDALRTEAGDPDRQQRVADVRAAIARQAAALARQQADVELATARQVQQIERLQSEAAFSEMHSEVMQLLERQARLDAKIDSNHQKTEELLRSVLLTMERRAARH